MVEKNIGDPDFVWPSQTILGNGLQYFITTYRTCVRNNLVTHCKTRIRYFLRMKCYEWNNDAEHNGLVYDKYDIENTIKALFSNQGWSDGNQNRLNKIHNLRNAVLDLGFPNEWFYFKAYVKHNWLPSLWIFAQIQRYMQKFNEKYSYLRHLWRKYNNYNKNNKRNNKKRNKKKPNGKKPMKAPPLPNLPTIHGFSIVPICRFQLKHVRLDSQNLFHITNNVRRREDGKLYTMTVKLRDKLKGNDTDERLIRSKVESKKSGNLIQPRPEDYKNRDTELWSIMFNMRKIRQISKNWYKDFHFHILTDSVSASLLFKLPKKKPINEDVLNRKIQQRYEQKYYTNEIGIDPGDKTYIAAVVRDTKSGNEANVKMSSPRYHWNAKQGIRDRKAHTLTHEFVRKEQRDRAGNAVTASPRGKHWRQYIIHRIKMVRDGIATYARRKYARLDFDKYIESNRAMDEIAVKLTRNKPSIVYLGGAELSPNRPIGIKKYRRCPGTRRIAASIKKLGHSDVVFVDEYNTSQTCANRYKKFDPTTKRDRYKVCKRCKPVPQGDPAIDPDMDKNSNLPGQIVAENSKRNSQKWRRYHQVRLRYLNLPIIHPLVPKVKYCHKDWPEILGLAENERKTVVWHRDIVAAKCILYKGRCKMFGDVMHQSFIREPRQPPPPFRPEVMVAAA